MNFDFGEGSVAILQANAKFTSIGDQMTEFKVGDEIEAIKDWSPYFKTGDRGEVLRVGSGDLYVQFKNQENQCNDGLWCVRFDQAKFIKQKEETMDLKEAYLAMHKASGIKVGDTVRVIRTCKSGEMGWDSDWTGPKNKYVGQQFEVKRDLQECGFSDPEEYYFPFFVLEKIKDAKQPVKVKLNDSYTEEYKGGETVHVGCQDIPKIAVFELADKIREYDK